MVQHAQEETCRGQIVLDRERFHTMWHPFSRLKAAPPFLTVHLFVVSPPPDKSITISHFPKYEPTVNSTQHSGLISGFIFLPCNNLRLITVYTRYITDKLFRTSTGSCFSLNKSRTLTRFILCTLWRYHKVDKNSQPKSIRSGSTSILRHNCIWQNPTVISAQ